MCILHTQPKHWLCCSFFPHIVRKKKKNAATATTQAHARNTFHSQILQIRTPSPFAGYVYKQTHAHDLILSQLEFSGNFNQWLNQLYMHVHAHKHAYTHAHRRSSYMNMYSIVTSRTHTLSLLAEAELTIAAIMSVAKYYRSHHSRSLSLSLSLFLSDAHTHTHSHGHTHRTKILSGPYASRGLSQTLAAATASLCWCVCGGDKL